MSGKRLKYPGRDMVLTRWSASDIKYRQMMASAGEGQQDRFACSSPYERYAIGLPSPVLEPKGSPVPVTVQFRCRTCANCLNHKRRLWTARAVDELRLSRRTWFGTLTCHPEARFQMEMRAASLIEPRLAADWRDIDSATKYKALCDILTKEMQKWLKRVRKDSSARLRYLLVLEAHKDGFPHVHILLHEINTRVAKSLLEKHWRFGFSHWRLVDTHSPASAYYTCKYLTKSHQTRVKASLKYGHASVKRLTEVAEGLTDAAPKATE